jgi:hypothetical protein
MSLYEQVIAAFPELEDSRAFADGTIILQNDSDGTGDYIAGWNYSKPLTEELQSFLR